MTAIRSRANAAAVIAGWPRRHVIVAFTFLGCVIAYTDRVNISIAAITMKEQFSWSQTQKGVVLSAFFVGYLSFMFVAGLLASRFGGKRVLGCSVFAWSIFTLLTPAAATISIALLIAARIGMGIGEAAMFPAGYELFGRWAPPAERARAVARMTSGVPVGTLVGLMGSGWLVQRYGWGMAFYAFGVVGILWVILWFWRIENDPAADRRLSAEERALLSAVAPMTNTMNPVPLRRLLMQAPVVATVSAHIASNWTLYVLISWLPSYFRDVQGLSIAHAGLFSAAPWLVMFAVGNTAASVADRMIHGGMSVTTTRKLMQSAALIGSAGCLLALHWAHSAPTALVLLCGAMGAFALNWSGYMSGYLDIAPRHGALLMGFGNTFGTIPGIIGVGVTGWIVDVTGTYTAAFVLAAIISVVGALIFWSLFDGRPIVG